MLFRQTATEPPALPGGLPLLGHAAPFSRNPVAFLVEAQRRLGDVFTIRILGRKFTVFCGPHASDALFRADDQTLGRRRAYRSMTPVFGKGILFDAPTDVFDQHVSFLLPALQGRAMREHVQAMVDEVDAYVAGWGDEGYVDLVEVMSELSVFIAARCLIGPTFRRLVGGDLARLFDDLKSAGRMAWLLTPNLPLPSFRRRDRARRELISRILEAVRSINDGEQQSSTREPLIDKLMSSRYADGTGISEETAASLLLAFVVAGEHNTAALASWTGALLLQDPAWIVRVIDEQTRVVGREPSRLTHQALQQMNELRMCMMEAGRLHPPTTVLLRDAEKEFYYDGYRIPRGSRIMLSPAASHHLPGLFAHPDRYDPDRFSDQRAGREAPPAQTMTFGGGRHRCTGMAFAHQEIMIVWSVLLGRFDIELVDTSPRPDYAAVTAAPRRPCRVKYRRRIAVSTDTAEPTSTHLPRDVQRYATKTR